MRCRLFPPASWRQNSLMSRRGTAQQGRKIPIAYPWENDRVVMSPVLATETVGSCALCNPEVLGMERLGILWPPTISHDVIDASRVVNEGNVALCCQPLHLFRVRRTGSKSFTMHCAYRYTSLECCRVTTFPLAVPAFSNFSRDSDASR